MTGSTNTVATGSAAQPADGTDGKTITVEVTAKNAQGVEVAATNGVATVEFDGEKLELTHVVVHAGYKSVVTGDGTVKFAYANSEEIAAGQPIATLTFQAKPCISTDITMTHHQVNEEKPLMKRPCWRPPTRWSCGMPKRPPAQKQATRATRFAPFAARF